jgi:hypothetical protein
MEAPPCKFIKRLAGTSVIGHRRDAPGLARRTPAAGGKFLDRPREQRFGSAANDRLGVKAKIQNSRNLLDEVLLLFYNLVEPFG